MVSKKADNRCYQVSLQDFSASLEGKVFKTQVIIFYSNLYLHKSFSAQHSGCHSFWNPCYHDTLHFCHKVLQSRINNATIKVSPTKVSPTFSTNLCLNLILPFFLPLEVSQPCFSQAKMSGKQKLSAALRQETNVT